ncbi:hypothetical protein E3N88_44421 [Mikania micrantha]|uniref:Uncharacterized protein n=1 Tax=Mikania micrantha TaxID=192012 RepID=A0A5N6LC38_9ASTR|nr:hypothetical protein E3N88_44421 [Mikania micrantha]
MTWMVDSGAFHHGFSERSERACAPACKMGTPSLRVRLVFDDRSILSETQRSDAMNNSWLLLKLQQHRTISDVCTHLLHIFNLHRSCPNGILLSMEGFTLPPFESTEILKEKEIICVKKKGDSTTDACNLLDDVLEPQDDGLILLANDNFNKETKEYHSESEKVDEEQAQDEELPEKIILKKRKPSTNLQNLKRKKQCLAMLGDDEDEAEPEEVENINNNASHPMKAPSRSARRKKAKRQWMQELAKIAKKKPQQAYSKPENTKPKNKEANDQPKGLLYWKQASKKHAQNGDAGLLVTRPGPIRFESLDEDQAAKQTGVLTEKRKWNVNSGKKKCQNWGREEFSTFRRNDHAKRVNKESFKMLFKDSKVPVIDTNDFDKLPPCSEPKVTLSLTHTRAHTYECMLSVPYHLQEGDVIAYRLLELNSSWIPEFSSFRVGRITYYDAKDIVLIPVTDYPIVSEKVNEDGHNNSLYGEDGTLEINYSALVDVRNVKQYDPDATEPLSDGVDRTHKSDDKDAIENLVSNSNNNIDVPKHSNPGSEVNPSSYDGAGPSTNIGPDASKSESSEVKEGQKDNPSDPWLNATKPESSKENNSGWSKALGSTAKDQENGSSWGRPWSAFVVSRSSSVIQQNKENEWHVGSSRGGWKPMSRGASRGRGRGHGGSRGRGRGRGKNGK